MSLYQFSAMTLDGDELSLEAYKGRALLVVNVASRCGFTPQYAGLETLWTQYGSRGLTVLGFPCDQFGHQEPGNAEEIQSFCTSQFGITFPLFAKIEVNGPHAHPLFNYLKTGARGFLGSAAIKWNFTKFLVNRNGQVVRRYGSIEAPEKIAQDIEALL